MNGQSRRILKLRRRLDEENIVRNPAVFKTINTAACTSSSVKRKNDDGDYPPPKKPSYPSGTNLTDCEYPPPKKTNFYNVSKANNGEYPSPKTPNLNYEHADQRTHEKSAANDRLSRYRKSLERRKNEIVKVHQVLAESPKHASKNGCKNDFAGRSFTTSTPTKAQLKSELNGSNVHLEKPCNKSLGNIFDRSQLSSSNYSNSLNASEKSTGKVNRSNISPMLNKSLENCVIKQNDSHSLADNSYNSNKSQCAQNSRSTVNTSVATSSDSLTVNVGNYSNVNDDLDYEMDWSPINEEEVISDIQKLRESIKEKHVYFKSMSEGLTARDHNVNTDNNVYIVVDTNIFVSQLNLVKNIMNFTDDHQVPIVYIPWMVLQELDYFKEGRSGSSAIQGTARKAIKFINACLSVKNSHMKGQSVQDALKQELSSSNPDDGILFCCIQLVQDKKTTILLSSDLNLRNKALINGIVSYGPNDIIHKIKAMKSKTESKNSTFKTDQIVTIFTNLCSHIIEKEMEKSYGATTYNLITKPPWTLKTCLIYLKRFWAPVFSMIITQKQCSKVVDDLLYCVATHKDLEEHIEEFLKLSLSLCVYFKNCLGNYEEHVKVCINNIQKLAS